MQSHDKTLDQLLKDGSALERKHQSMHDAIQREIDALVTTLQSTRQSIEECMRKDSLKRKASGSDETLQSSDPSARKIKDQLINKSIQELCTGPVIDTVGTSTAKEFQTFHAVLSKYGKSMDKKLCKDIDKVHKPVEMDAKVIHSWIAKHLYQQGLFQSFKCFVEEANLDIEQSSSAPFQEIYDVLDSLHKRDLEPALRWVKQYREKLSKLRLEQDIEFQLLRLQFLRMLQEGSFTDSSALQYAQQHFPSYIHESRCEDIQRLMGCLAYRDHLKDSPYRDLLENTHWEKAKRSLMEACCLINGTTLQTPLSLCLSAGTLNLPHLRKMYTVVESSSAKWQDMVELPVEVKLPKEMNFHSIFVCPVSKDKTTEENPPILLKCGHVICQSCVDKIGRVPGKSNFKCPTCPLQQTVDGCQEIHF